MEYILLIPAAFLTSLLTFFSGFGLGTLLLPLFAIFFPLPLAVLATAIVHFLNNFFKLALVGKQTNREAAVRFGLPALFSAALGALLLSYLAHVGPIADYRLFGITFFVSPLKITIGTLMISFAILEIVNPPWQLPPRFLPLGGVISGFFGGLSGHQGAFRTMFLIRAGLSKESFIATGIVIACLVDITRIPIYFMQRPWQELRGMAPLLASSTLSAFAGAYFGRELLKKATFPLLQKIIAALLTLMGGALILGIL